MKKTNLPPELKWKTVQYRHQLKPAAHVWPFGKFNDLFQEPKITEIVNLDSKIYQNYYLPDPFQMVIGDPLPGGGVTNKGRIVYSEWNIGPDPCIETDWYISLSEEDANEVYQYLVFMYLYFGNDSSAS